MRSESRDAVSPGPHFHWRQDTLRRKQNKEGISETLRQERKGPSKVRGSLSLHAKLNHEFKVAGWIVLNPQFLGQVVLLGW